MAKITLNQDDYLDKVRGCWMGKNIGGTIGEPFEWYRQRNQVEFYTQKLKGKAAPNDDLDIQLLWLIAMEERGVDLDAHILAEYWCQYVTPHWNEYGRGKVNMRSGLLPPLSGSYDNVYKDSCGSFIRSEIWACVAPGLPDLAAYYAFQDAILDHGDGEGTYGEVFCSATESAAFVIKDLRQCIEIGLSYIPEDCGTAAAVRTAIELAEAKASLDEARHAILDRHRGAAAKPAAMFDYDLEKGFDQGKDGYDAPSNIAITIWALLDGGDDFGRVQCSAVNCGEDTDCTAATAGALWGILRGYKEIPKKWIEPIGDDIVTVSLNKGELGHFGANIPQNVTELTERTHAMAKLMLQTKARSRLALSGAQATDLSSLQPASLRSPDRSAALFRGLRGPVFKFPFFTVQVDYGGDPVISDGQEKRLLIRIDNTYKPQANLSFTWHLPDGWAVSPSRFGHAAAIHGRFRRPAILDCSLFAERVTASVNRAALEITVDGRPTVMHVPIALLNGNYPNEPRGSEPSP